MPVNINGLEAAERALLQQKRECYQSLYKVEGALEVVRGQLKLLRDEQSIETTKTSSGSLE